MASDVSSSSDVPFANPFHIEDLQVFDDDTMRHMFVMHGFGLTYQDVAHSVHGASEELVQRIQRCLPEQMRLPFLQELQRPLSEDEIEHARRRVLDDLFWELIYWKTPELYEELTRGEGLHPGIFQSLASDVREKIILDAGAGSGRASFECMRYQAQRVYAVEPSPGLLRLLERKIHARRAQGRIIPLSGRFDALPLSDHSVDLALSCSAFTATDEQGGEPGLVELKRVTRPGGKIVIIWPRVHDRGWFRAHGFQYVSLADCQGMRVRFRSLRSAFHCARLFYAHNKEVERYLHAAQKPEIPFSVIGMNPPCDYFWLEV